MRLPRPRLCADGWYVTCEVSARREVLGPFPDDLAAKRARCDWMSEECWKANLRTIAALDRAHAALAEFE